MNVLEFIRDKKEDFQENTAQFRAMLEPTFQSWSNRLNDHITNTLNNPWIANLNPFESRHLFNSRKVFKNPMVKDMYEDLNKKKAAEESIKKSIEINPNYAEAYNALGLLYNTICKSEDSYL